MTNKQLMSKFEKANTHSVCAYNYPFLGGNRATFFQNVDAAGGWLIAVDSTDPASNKSFAYEIPQALVDAASAIDFDVYNNAAYANALLFLSDGYRA